MEFGDVFVYLILLVVGLKIIFYIWYILRTYFLTKIGFTKSLKDYGEWAVVTGATDGIGKEYAKQLAQKGLNVCLISRSKAKLDATAKEIKESTDVKTKIIVFDFSYQDDYEKIREELINLDIGILINNVGMFARIEENSSVEKLFCFEKLPIKKLVQNVNVNVTSIIQMTHMVLPGMKIKNKGAIVHVSSCAAHTVVPLTGVYSATKLFVEKLVSMLQMEAHGVVDHQILIPAFVATKMSRKKAKFAIPTSEEYVKSAIRTIGVADVTNGCLSHEFTYLLLKITPLFVVEFFLKKAIQNELNKEE